MAEAPPPEWFEQLTRHYRGVFDALDTLGREVREAGPLDARTAHLVQLAAAAALRSEGAVHSHARRALKEGVSREELEHTVLLLTSTIGFPNVSAALSWVNDVTAARVEEV